MKTCPACNTQLQDDATFCSACGTPIAAEANEQQGAPVYAQPAPQYAAVQAVDPYDHTAEFDETDISENKCYAMLIYLMSIIGIIIALLASKDSPYIKFHLRQAIKIEVVTILLALAASILSFTIIVPIAAAICLVILVVIRIICFFQICSGKAVEPAIVRSLKFLK